MSWYSRTSWCLLSAQACYWAFALSLRKFSYSPTLLIGFKSRLSARLFHQLILFFSKKVWMYQLVCLGSLYWYSLCPSGYIFVRNGRGRQTECRHTLSPYLVAVMISPSCVAPLFEIPAHTWKFAYTYIYFSFRWAFFFWKDFHLWHSNWTVHSSVKMQSSKHSSVSTQLLTQATLFSLSPSQMAWQYQAVVKVHPNSLHTLAIVFSL